MLRGWKLSLFGILIVGATAIIAPMFDLIPIKKSVPLFILFVMFVGALELMEWLKRNRNLRKFK